MIIELADGGQLSYFENFFTKEASDLLFQVLLKKTPWKQEKTFYGNTFPRLTSYYADDGVKYSYSGATHESLQWPHYLLEVKKRVQKESGKTFNSMLLNYYRDGKDSIGWHSDNEKELGLNPTIASISLGAERNFQIRHNKNKEKQEYILKHGSLLIMDGTMQHHWQHCVPKTTKEIGPRINLTLRNIY